jgi:hypothetical protein
MIRISRTIYNETYQCEEEVEKVVRLDNVAYILSFYLSVASLRMFIKKDIH